MVLDMMQIDATTAPAILVAGLVLLILLAWPVWHFSNRGKKHWVLVAGLMALLIAAGALVFLSFGLSWSELFL